MHTISAVAAWRATFEYSDCANSPFKVGVTVARLEISPQTVTAAAIRTELRTSVRPATNWRRERITQPMNSAITSVVNVTT
jgi:hypothetical protein